MPLISQVDQVYLNTLLHNSNEFYIKLVDTNYVDEKLDQILEDIRTAILDEA